MIRHPWLLALALLGTTLAARRAQAHPRLARLFDIVPLPFWCYALPMLGTSAGLWPSQSPLYLWCSRQVLPVALGLLVIGSDLRGLARVGRQAVGLLWIGALGVFLGALAALRLWGAWLPPDAWQGMAALAATWTGGSMNFLAVKEALGLSDAAVAPLIVTDTCITYGWMALLLAGARASRSQESPFAGPRSHFPSGKCGAAARPHSSPEGDTMLACPHDFDWRSQSVGVRPPRAPAKGTPGPLALLAFAIALSWGAQRMAGRMPAIAGLTAVTWTVMLVTTAALGLSLTPLGQWARREPVPRFGNMLLLLLLASIGARADLRSVLQAPVFLLAGATVLLTHAALLSAVGWLQRAPRGLLATVSQANLGGVISAPAVAAAYDATLVPVGLLLAVLGNVAGTYVGLLTAFAGRWIQQAVPGL